MRLCREPFVTAVSRVMARAESREAGLSMIGMLVTLVIMGAMSAIVLAGLNSTTNDGGVPTLDAAGANNALIAAADLQACEASATALERAAQAYFASHGGTWPADIAALTQGTPPYLKSAPDPRWGLVYDSATGSVDATGCTKLTGR
jgi:type II secretory pathway pseudopilin PulG